MSQATVPSRRMQRGERTEEEFERMSSKEKEKIIEKVFGKEVPA
jgi:hypothetical protein